MKKFWVVMLSLGLIAALALPAAAAELRMSGNWYMAGWYVDNPSGLDKDTTRATDPSWGTYTNNPARNAGSAGSLVTQTAGDPRHNRGSVAYYTHRLTLTPDIKIVEGLTLKMSIDMLEGVMGDNSWKQTNGGALVTPTTTTRLQDGGAQNGNGVFIQENLEVNNVYVDFKTALGRIEAGYVSRGLGWGTAFMNDPYAWAGVQYSNVFGPMTFMASTFNIREYSNRSNYGVGVYTNGVWSDADSNQYNIAGIYKIKPGEVGMNIQLWRDSRAKQNFASGAPDSTGLRPTGNQGWVTELYMLQPYTKLKYGNFFIEAEGFYQFGQLRKYESFVTGTANEPDVDIKAFGAYIRGQYDMKPFFIGGTFAYMSGDDMDQKDEVTGSLAQWMGNNYVGSAFLGTLILWNNDYSDHMGNTIVGNIVDGNPRTGMSYRGTRYFDNAWFYQIYGGMNVTPKLNLTGRLSYAKAAEKPKMGIGATGSVLTAQTTQAAYIGAVNREFANDDIGMELDLTATYKIYDNLSYQVGAGYLWTGDYFKGYDNGAQIKDNYILTHKLSLFF